MSHSASRSWPRKAAGIGYRNCQSKHPGNGEGRCHLQPTRLRLSIPTDHTPKVKYSQSKNHHIITIILDPEAASRETPQTGRESAFFAPCWTEDNNVVFDTVTSFCDITFER